MNVSDMSMKSMWAELQVVRPKELIYTVCCKNIAASDVFARYLIQDITGWAIIFEVPSKNPTRIPDFLWGGGQDSGLEL